MSATAPRRSPFRFRRPAPSRRLWKGAALVGLFALGASLPAFSLTARAAETALRASADSYAHEEFPTKTHGSRVVLKVDASPVKRAYVRFDVSGLGSAPSRATLKLYVVHGSGSGLEAFAVSGDWSESSLTYVNAPAPGAKLASAGAVSEGGWASFDVTSAVSGNGPVSFAVGSSGDSFQLASREAAIERAPQLVVESGGSAEPTTSAGSTGTSTTTPTTTAATTTTTTTTTTDTHPPEPPPPAGSSDPTACAGYAQPRVFLESQAWWTQTPGKAGTDFGHLHSATCFPMGQTLSGVVHFDVRLMMHKNAGVLTRLRIQIWNSGAPDPIKLVTLGHRCAVETCTWWVPVDIDTRLANDGCQEFRFQAWAKEPDGKEMVATTGWRANLKNGNPLGSYCDARGVNFTEGRGWYTGMGYENGRLDDPFPLAPVSGIWSPKLKAGAGFDGIAPTGHMITVDPNFHMGHHGIVLSEGAGSFTTSRLPIDTTKLSNGRHRLAIRTDANTPSGSTLSGLLVFPFTVAN